LWRSFPDAGVAGGQRLTRANRATRWAAGCHVAVMGEGTTWRSAKLGGHRWPTAGLVWPPHESGRFQAQDTVLSKAGNTYLRYYLVEAANSVRLHCAEYRDFYQAKLAQSPKHAHKRALVLTARKLVRLVDALLRAGAVYHAQDRKEGQTRPHMARPRPHRRTPVVPAAT
jgi:transposase